MHWNYRVMELKDEAGELYFDVVEVYYEDDGSLMGWCEGDPFSVYEEQGEALASIKQTLGNIEAALEKPVLRPVDFGGDKE